ncbi:MAG: PhoH family protein [Chitinophagales bacterium]
MNELNINIEGVSLSEFFGVNNSKFDLLRRAYPKLRIIPRGSNIKVVGNAQIIDKFAAKVDEIVDFLQNHGRIAPKHIEEIIAGLEPTEVPNGKSDVILYGPNGNLIKAKTPNQKVMVKQIDENDILFAIGPAGTGKTYTAVALAVRALKNRIVKKIVLTRPAVEAGESLGFLPGDLKDKVDPYLRPLYDALDDMIPRNKLAFYMENRTIEIAPLAFMRGRTIDNAFIILDEAQNATNLQLKMFLTRLGPSAKCIITGDLTQIDLPRNQRSGLSRCLHILEDVRGIGMTFLTNEDVIRHRLVKRIIEAYHKDDLEQEELEKEEAKQRKEQREKEKQERMERKEKANTDS